MGFLKRRLPKAGIVLLGLAILVGLTWLFLPHKAIAPATKQDAIASSRSKALGSNPTFDKSQHSLSDPTSPWVVVNKHRPLPAGYAPDDLSVPRMPLAGSASAENMHVRKAMAATLEQMAAAGTKAGVNLELVSGYRSQAYQTTVYNSFVKRDGQAKADTYSARPRFSEHQTGWAADLGRTDGKCAVADCFVGTKEAKWLAVNAYKYGFIIRYPQGQTAVTGYQYEPWHVRFVGTALATQMHKDKTLTLEGFFNLESAPNYE